MFRLIRGSVIAIVSFAVMLGNAQTTRDPDRVALEKTSERIRAAFSVSDVEAIMKYHHPQVNKALSFQKVLLGREAVAADLKSIGCWRRRWKPREGASQPKSNTQDLRMTVRHEGAKEDS
jgi:hypothetical protein